MWAALHPDKGPPPSPPSGHSLLVVLLWWCVTKTTQGLCTLDWVGTGLPWQGRRRRGHEAERRAAAVVVPEAALADSSCVVMAMAALVACPSPSSKAPGQGPGPLRIHSGAAPAERAPSPATHAFSLYCMGRQGRGRQEGGIRHGVFVSCRRVGGVIDRCASWP